MVILSVVSAKGGVGKTTLAANLALGLSARRPVLAADMDPQNALRLHLGVAYAESDGLAKAAVQGLPWVQAVRPGSSPGVHVLPFGAVSETERDAWEVLMSQHPLLLREQLGQLGLPVQGVVVIDTPPGPSLYQQQALRAADIVLVVVLPDAASYATVPAMEAILDTYCHGRADFAGSAYLINNVPPGSALSRDVIRVLRSSLGVRVAPMVVHSDEAVREALAHDRPVLQYAPQGEATRDILQLVSWMEDWVARVHLNPAKRA